LQKMNKYLIYVSIVLNGILLMVLFGIIPFLLYLSILVNMGVFWYTINVLRKNSELEQDIVAVVEKLEGFSDHLEDIHGLEIYYGDENLQKLIDHSRNLINDFIDFQASYFDVEVEEFNEEEEN
jgi:hypothetical protein